MPRLTSKDYLAQRRLLIKEWCERDAIAFGEVPLQGQHDLHDFYAPTEPLSDADALEHRVAMAKAFPSLPQKAGRALQALLLGREVHRQRMADRKAVSATLNRPPRGRGVYIAAVARQEPDLRLLAKALIGLAESDTDGSLLRELQSNRKGRC